MAESFKLDSVAMLELTRKMARLGSFEHAVNEDQILWSDEMFELFGIPVQQGPLTYEQVSQMVHPDDRALHREAIRRTIQDGQHEFEHRVICPNGTIRWLWTAAMAHDQAGRPVRLVGVAQDITKRKQAESALRQSEVHLRSIIDNTGAGYFFIDADGVFREVNAAWVRMYRYRSKDEVVGQHFAVVQKADDLEKAGEFVKGIMAGDSRYLSGEFSRKCKDDSIGWHSFSARPVTRQGKVVGIEGLIIDATERRHMEQELQKAQRLESLGMLAGGIAHEFNNLMSSIFGHIELARDEPDRRSISAELSKAMETIDRARALTQQLLTFAKGGAPIQKVGNLFPFVEISVAFALRGANVSCQMDVAPDLWACNFDKNQIGQVFDNLVINAQQAMPMGGVIELVARNVSLAAREHPTLGQGNYVKLSVKDRGVGMAKELMARIFDPFFTTKARGHGLGLSTCYSIVKRHGGCIDVESEPGKGSTFHVYLPAHANSVGADPDSLPAQHQGRGTFLVMDDEEIVRETFRGMLASFGYTVVCKDNGREAVDFFAAEAKAGRRLSGMIVDLTVTAGMGGQAAVDEIRKLDREVPVFVASGYAEDPVMKNPGVHGFTASICKPFRKVELSEMLNKYVQR